MLRLLLLLLMSLLLFVLMLLLVLVPHGSSGYDSRRHLARKGSIYVCGCGRVRNKRASGFDW